MKRIVTLILSVLLIATTMCCTVAQHHHHDGAGRPCLCLHSIGHAPCSHGHDHGREPHSCKRFVLSLTADSQQRHAAVPLPAPHAAVAVGAVVCPAPVYIITRHVCRGACCAATIDGCSAATALRGPPAMA